MHISVELCVLKHYIIDDRTEGIMLKLRINNIEIETRLFFMLLLEAENKQFCAIYRDCDKD